MKHYPHHIGDFNQATRHLTRLERSVYRDLIDLYYDTEQQLPLDVKWICRKILANSNDESTAVEQTLNEFFTETPTGWYHERCEAEIEHYRTNASQKAIAGRASAAAKAAKKELALNGKSTDVATPVKQTNNGTPTNQEPVTKNHKPVIAAPSRGRPADVSQEVWDDFVAQRKRKKAPITETAMRGIEREVAAAGWKLEAALVEICARGWVGFKAEWVAPRQAQTFGQQVVGITVPGKQGVDPELAKAIKDSLSGAKPSAEIKAKIDSLRGVPA